MTDNLETPQSDPKKYESFDEMDLHDNLVRGIYAYGFEHPSKIQQLQLALVFPHPHRQHL